MFKNQVIYVKSNFNVDGKEHTHPYVIYNNYRYWWKKDNKQSKRYCCSEKAKRKCTSSITIDGNNQIIRHRNHHDHHGLTDEEIQITIEKQILKTTVTKNVTDTIQTLYIDTQDKLVAQNIPDNVIALYLPSFEKMTSSLQKRRQNELPTIPANFEEFEIKDKYALTNRDEPFLRYDNKSSEQRILIFVADKALELLSKYQNWYMDGTFKSAPNQFKQIYTIHAFVKTSGVACAYIFMQKKNESSYREIFGYLKDLATSNDLILNPETVMTDFEKSAINAIIYHFPNIKVRGCWFHLKQAIFKNAVKYGLKQNYNNAEYRLFINKLGALALIPCDKIDDGLQHIENTMPKDQKCEKLISYFKKQWIQGVDKKQCWFIFSLKEIINLLKPFPFLLYPSKISHVNLHEM